MTIPSISHAVAQVRAHGVRDVSLRACKRTLERLTDRLQLQELDFPLRPEDIADSALGKVQQERGADWHSRAQCLNVGWVCAPPKQGSGGHTTLFRMVAAMIEQGHNCTIFLYDKNSNAVERHKEAIRDGWPWLKADVLSATDATDFLDVVIASSWESAHVVASRMSAVPKKFYFAQDYEPYFHPRGSIYCLAEDTYRFGFHNIALGKMVAESIRRESGAPIHGTVPFGSDRRIYHLKEASAGTPKRSGIVFYAKKNTDRRGYLLAKQALEIFGNRNPEHEIHVYGDSVTGWHIPITSHGNLRPEQLNDLYNSTVASLVLSFTNISLVAGELISAGNIPVMNDSELAKLDMDSSFAVWAPATPEHLASALEKTLQHPDIAGRASSAAKELQISWQQSQQVLCQIIESACFANDSPTPVSWSVQP